MLIEVAPFKSRILKTSLSNEQEKRLQSALSSGNRRRVERLEIVLMEVSAWLLFSLTQGESLAECASSALRHLIRQGGVP